MKKCKYFRYILKLLKQFLFYFARKIKIKFSHSALHHTNVIKITNSFHLLYNKFFILVLAFVNFKTACYFVFKFRYFTSHKYKLFYDQMVSVLEATVKFVFLKQCDQFLYIQLMKTINLAAAWIFYFIHFNGSTN